MLEMLTGLNTAIHMTEPHKDGGSLVTMSHHTDLHPDNKEVGQYLVDPPRRYCTLIFITHVCNVYTILAQTPSIPKAKENLKNS